jgi:hypothetical protein
MGDDSSWAILSPTVEEFDSSEGGVSPGAPRRAGERGWNMTSR